MKKIYKKQYDELDKALEFFLRDSSYCKKRFVDVLLQAELLGFPLAKILIQESKEVEQAARLITKVIRK